jgi:hypothetical protein
MTTYDNLNIAETTLIFDENGSTAVGAGEFNLSSMAFLPNVPLIDQIEVERVFLPLLIVDRCLSSQRIGIQLMSKLKY